MTAPKPLSIALLTLAMSCLAALPASAHTRSRMSADVSASPASGQLSITMEMHEEDLGALLDPEGHLTGKGLPEADEITTTLAQEARQWLLLSSAGAACPTTFGAFERVGIQGVRVTSTATCPGPAAELTLDWRAPALTNERMELVLRVEVPDAPAQTMTLTADDSTTSMSLREASAWESAKSFTVLGVEHILTGWDHLAFLLALLLACGTLRRLLIMVSGFTLAHSITLCLGAFDLIRLPASIVEPIIAASIALVALFQLERLWRGKLDYPGGQLEAPGAPWREVALCLGFGLVHGLGFAGMLADALENATHLAVPIFSFNLGVELGQLFCVLLAFPLLAMLGRWRHGRAAMAVILIGLVVLGTGVTWARVMG